ncbi:MAG TPA: RNA polymerase sigma-70 factor [Solirubrobacteraceae bacterium]|nr:RNA polymerase sigma-70 factor [Solirubrobacteraceae bacterium]
MADASVTTETYESLRPLAFSIAYRMLGSVTEAEDIVQEGLLRLHRAEGVEHPRAFVATVVTRLSIDELRSARARRETYPGAWLPEPIVTDSRPDDESVSMALLITLERLTPVERAVFLLHDVFDYGYDEIAEIVGKTRENCRQLALRARRHVEASRTRFETSREQRERLAARFFEAIREGDLDGLVELLAEDAVATGDGGGKGEARATPLVGGVKVARFMLGLMRLAERRAYTLEFTELNGEPGALIREDGEIAGTMVIETSGDRITNIYSVVNPDKLRHLKGLSL